MRIVKEEDVGEDVGLSELVDTLVWGDCIRVMEKMPAESVDMVFFDPPYFLQLPRKKLVRWYAGTIVESPEREWDVFSSYEEYDSFLEKTLKLVKRVMKPNATIWAIGTYHNIFRVGKIMQDLGFWILNEVVWFKANPMPNWLNVRFTNAVETLIWAVKDRDVKNYTFNKDVARKFAIEDFGSKIALSIWRIPVCMGRERLRDEEGRRLHPTQKPVKLLERVILVSTRKGDIVFDPMAGTGTTGYAAWKHGRHFIMVEKEEKYVNAIIRRFNMENT